MSSLYEPMLERDVDAIRGAAVSMAESEGDDALCESIARFAVLAWAPAQHARHALLAALAVRDLRTELGTRFRDALIECAIYASQSRLPWSEPPLLDPPALDGGETGLDEIRDAVREKDRLRSERWLAARLDDDDLVQDYFTLATDDGADVGHRLIVSTAAWRCAMLLGERGRYAALRPAVWEWCATSGTPAGPPFSGDRATLLETLVAAMEQARGDLVVAQELHRFDAALLARSFGVPGALVARALGSIEVVDAAPAPIERRTPLPVYPYARDRAGYLEAWAIAQRLEAEFGSAIGARIRAAACDNLVRGEELEDWSFA